MKSLKQFRICDKKETDHTLKGRWKDVNKLWGQLHQGRFWSILLRMSQKLCQNGNSI